MGVAHKRAQMMGDVMVETAHEPADERVFGRIIGRRRKDVIHAVVKLTALRGKVRAVDGMGGLNTSVTDKPTTR